MRSPYTNKEMEFVVNSIETTFRDEKFNVKEYYYYCNDSNKKIISPEFARVNEALLYNSFRNKHSIPYPQDLEVFRNFLNVPYRTLSQIFGFGINQWKQYELGKLPSNSNANMLKSLGNKDFVIELVKLNIDDTNTQNEIIKNYKKYYAYKKYEKELNIKYNVFKPENPSLHGFRSLSILKAINILNYISKYITKGKVALNKILYFIEYEAFSKNKVSISGLTFQAIQMGPVPSRYDIIFNMASIENYIKEEDLYDINDNYYQSFSNGEKEFEENIFTLSEIEIIKEKVSVLKVLTKKELEDLSHREKGWIENYKNKDYIDYLYVFAQS